MGRCLSTRAARGIMVSSTYSLVLAPQRKRLQEARRKIQIESLYSVGATCLGGEPANPNYSSCTASHIFSVNFPRAPRQSVLIQASRQYGRETLLHLLVRVSGTSYQECCE